MTVYPRVCGGTSPEARVARVKDGLSPRVRGNRLSCMPITCGRGSIPACAGEPCGLPTAFCGRPVYPRVCGGTPGQPGPVMFRPGLSPRVRGNLRDAGRAEIRIGSIPACAGEPAIRQPGQSIVKVYPRVCGGTVRRAFRSVLLKGLSPRVRGNQSGVTNRAAAIGSIPACAGEPTKSGAADYAARVYPRVCGGTSARRAKQDTSAGLSPRVRGNPLGTTAMTVGARSIPACAGEPISLGITTICESVYPRVCGGTAYHRRKSLKQQGLSPRVRGNRLRAKEVVGGVGSIPACAGEPFPIRRPPYAGMVYPRVCGGTVN